VVSFYSSTDGQRHSSLEGFITQIWPYTTLRTGKNNLGRATLLESSTDPQLRRHGLLAFSLTMKNLLLSWKPNILNSVVPSSWAHLFLPLSARKMDLLYRECIHLEISLSKRWFKAGLEKIVHYLLWKDHPVIRGREILFSWLYQSEVSMFLT
jgi:hypothetical protein